MTMEQCKTHDSPSLISLANLFCRIATKAICHLITYPFRNTLAQTLRKDVLNAAIRTLLTHITVPQSRYLNQSTTQRYLTFCQSQRQTASTLSAPYESPDKGKAEAHAHWIGDPSAPVVILYFHGGAFFQPATAGTFLYLQAQLARIGKATEKSVAALVLAYSLAPEAAFPTQLREGAAVLRALLRPSSSSSSSLALSEPRKAGDVIVAGDSAGGSIALALVSHLLRGHPGVGDVGLEGRLGGVLLYSPSVSYSVDWDSMVRNAECDMLPTGKVPVWGAMYTGQTDSLQANMAGLSFETSAYSEPCVGGSAWWHGLSRVVGAVLVLSGGEEVFADAISELGRKMKQGWREDCERDRGEGDGVVFLETPGETHIGPIVDFIMSGGKGTSISQRSVDLWWAARLEAQQSDLDVCSHAQSNQHMGGPSR